MAGNPMISVCVRLRHIYSHIQTCTMGDALKLFEDIFSVDFSQNRTGTRSRGHHKLLCCHTQEIFFSEWYYLFKFFCRLLKVPVVPVSTSTEFISYRCIKKTRAATVFVLSKSRLSFKDDPAAKLASRWREVM
jgi:hypothetical protein